MIPHREARFELTGHFWRTRRQAESEGKRHQTTQIHEASRRITGAIRNCRTRMPATIREGDRENKVRIWLHEAAVSQRACPRETVDLAADFLTASSCDLVNRLLDRFDDAEESRRGRVVAQRRRLRRLCRPKVRSLPASWAARGVRRGSSLVGLDAGQIRGDLFAVVEVELRRRRVGVAATARRRG